MQMDFEYFYKNIALRIKHYRNIQHITQEELAEKAKISVDYLGKIEVNINKPGIVCIIKIINALNVSIAEFFSTFS